MVEPEGHDRLSEGRGERSLGHLWGMGWGGGPPLALLSTEKYLPRVGGGLAGLARKGRGLGKATVSPALAMYWMKSTWGASPSSCSMLSLAARCRWKWCRLGEPVQRKVQQPAWAPPTPGPAPRPLSQQSQPGPGEHVTGRAGGETKAPRAERPGPKARQPGPKARQPGQAGLEVPRRQHWPEWPWQAGVARAQPCPGHQVTDTAQLECRRRPTVGESEGEVTPSPASSSPAGPGPGPSHKGGLSGKASGVGMTITQQTGSGRFCACICL